MENISKNELQALVDQLVGKKWDKYQTMWDLRDILESNENYAHNIVISDFSSCPNYFEVCVKGNGARLFSVEVKRKKGEKHWTYWNSYCDWTVKEVIIMNYNENIQADIDRINQYEVERKQQEEEAKIVAKEVLNFLKNKGYDYWKRRKIINEAAHIDGYSYDKENE